MEICVRGYHIYQSVWTPTLDNYYICVGDSIDRYAVTVKNGDTDPDIVLISPVTL